ncbi:NADH-dependent flavin oxidoreductase [Pasteurellaceae bacterium USgator11]|nr:NADH-dependent flavin oxidoreductase [Pasteurellaceae bacterium USgator41]TNG92702.1 NADH-dependent flavin oxidoreductase [Pasteurellaceae bacterium UScroc12]TNG98114.1 NADH-dependent flavin oxidoreductase [Pasteurellaceae bacterium USgator11]TNG99109.1 NADH-dependent flavin oxidoreductase [Pasteurellaceae bacterium UScroc31]
MNLQYTPLLQPYTLNNGVEIKNRFVVAPMTHYASNPDGSASAEELAFLQGRAQDFGLFITAATLVSAEGKAFPGQPYAIGSGDLPSLKTVAHTIQAQGAKAILQIHHGGQLAVKELIDTADVVAPSANPQRHARALTEEEIQTLIQAFANATDLAIQAGFDGVEIHGANNYLLQQFFSAATNQRQDQWGGSLQNRLRFPLAVVDAVNSVKVRSGRQDFIIGYRFSPEEPGENGLTMQDTFALIDALVQKPLQYLHVSLWDFYKKVRRGADTALTRMQLIHQRINGKLPLIGVGSLFTADQILTAYQTGWAEFIALGKAVMMNPDLATLIANGRETEIITEIDPDKADRYRIPSNLWQQNMKHLAYLPPVKGNSEWKAVDI